VQAVYIAVFYALALTIEISQISPKIYGTFDPLDILCMGTAAFVEGVVHNFYVTRRLRDE